MSFFFSSRRRHTRLVSDWSSDVCSSDLLGWAYYKLNRLDLAEGYLKKAIIFYHTDASIHDHLGDLYFKTKRYEEALSEWTKSLQLATEKEEIDRVKKKLDDLKTSRAANK